MPNLTPEKRLLLIGASRGLGLAIADEYLKLGWHVVATVRSPSGTALHDLIDKSDGRLAIETVDIANPAQVLELRQRLARIVLTCFSSMRASRMTIGRPSPMSRPKSSSA